eukprot:TRINITY_DN6447_c0_g1_i1.p5 TRINITY_DN6447_c0_g1~~TRINITY_DN6447_c0_g1_i1.p5  ORF type:complete len:52 (+),score=13.10 TRINITY_DN6447_c0_g1_i1:693-848(+)
MSSETEGDSCIGEDSATISGVGERVGIVFEGQELMLSVWKLGLGENQWTVF